MKNLVSKLVGGLAVATLVIGSFSSTVNAQAVSMDEVEITATQELTEAQTMMASEWVITRNFFVVGDPK
ncbi:hypothetical protein [Flavobacterium sp. J27]|uniref:hypothetical protein n=1 Tax=Flavobacterium sp. J27 TaxID=2060419 RepID=UPI0010324BFB|nr:hypothetical protein [Flavobacterium sp. J27]